MRIGIIGGSLAGLACAHTLSRAGARVRVFERAAAGFETRGGGLGLDIDLTRGVTGLAAPPPHLLLTERQLWRADGVESHSLRERVTAYGALWSWLARTLPPGCLALGTPVVDTREHEPGVTLRLGDGDESQFDLVVCADGGQGQSFEWLPRGRPTYAGYVLWRGLCPRRHVEGAAATLDALALVGLPGRQFVAYPVPGYDGDTRREAQMINWGWYAPTPHAIAAELLRVGGRTLVPHALQGGAPPPHWRTVMDAHAQAWPSWVVALIDSTTQHGMIAPHPVREFDPPTLHRGRFVLVGDAAHLASPITGSGARMAMQDALDLARALREEHTLTAALARYEDARLRLAAQVVRAGKRAGAAFRDGDELP